jgi:hypothetical protein
MELQQNSIGAFDQKNKIKTFNSQEFDIPALLTVPAICHYSLYSIN